MIDELGVEGDFVAGDRVFNQVERRVEQVAAVARRSHADAILIQQRRVDCPSGRARQATLIGQRHFEHGHDLDVAVVVGAHCAVAAAGCFAVIKEGFVVPILHVALFVFGPVEHVKGIPELIRIGGAQLQVDIGVLVGLQSIDGERQWIGLTERHEVAAVILAGHQARNIKVIGHGIAIVVKVVEIRGAVAIAVGRSGIPFQTVHYPVVIAVSPQGIAVPSLAIVTKAGHLIAIRDGVEIGVGGVGIGADQRFYSIGQPVTVGVESGHRLRGGGRIGQLLHGLGWRVGRGVAQVALNIGGFLLQVARFCVRSLRGLYRIDPGRRQDNRLAL